MNKRILIVAGLALLAAAFWKREEIMVAVVGWKQANDAEKYLPMLRAAEIKYGLPPDLLSRVAFQESRFRDDIVSGKIVSSAGAKGIMQIIPRWHPTVDPLNVPAAIDYAGKFLKQLRGQFGSWPLAVAAYNAGPGNVRKYNGVPPFEETQNYVKEVFGDLLAHATNKSLYT